MAGRELNEIRGRLAFGEDNFSDPGQKYERVHFAATRSKNFNRNQHWWNAANPTAADYSGTAGRR